MADDVLGSIEYQLHLTQIENRKRIDELHSYATIKGLVEAGPKFHEMWMDWQDELWHRCNWECHLNFCIGLIRAEKGAILDPEDIEWTLDDYVYSK